VPGLWFHDVLGEVDHVLCDLDVLDVLKILGSVPHFNVKQAGIQSPGEHDGSCRRSHCHFIPLRYSAASTGAIPDGGSLHRDLF